MYWLTLLLQTWTNLSFDTGQFSIGLEVQRNTINQWVRKNGNRNNFMIKSSQQCMGCAVVFVWLTS